MLLLWYCDRECEVTSISDFVDSRHHPKTVSDVLDEIAVRRTECCLSTCVREERAIVFASRCSDLFAPVVLFID